MRNTVFFTETQRLKYSWIWLLLSVLSALSLGIGVYIQLVFAIDFGNRAMSDLGLILFSFLVPLVLLLIYFVFKKSFLKIDVLYEGVIIKYPVFIRKVIKLPYEEIIYFEARKYKPFAEFLGHGIKSKGKHYKSYTVSGRMGIDFRLKSGQRFFVGTKMPFDLIEALKNRIQKS